MSSGKPLQQTDTLSQSGSLDFLNSATAIAIPSLDTTPDGSSGSGTPLFPDNAFQDAAASKPIVLSGPITATGTAFNFLVSSGNFSINLEFDANAAAGGSSFESGIEQAASILVTDLRINNAITLNIAIDRSIAGAGAMGGPDYGTSVAYSTIRDALINNATSGDPNFNALPSGSSITGTDGTTTTQFSTVDLWAAEEKALGLLPGNAGAVDGYADFGNGVSASLLVGLGLHELTHAMGRISDGPTTPDIFDLFHFSSQGTILADGNATGGPSAYFSVDGGTTEIVTYGTSSDTSDFSNSGGLEDPFAEFYDFNTPQTLTALDKQQLDVLGFDTACFAEGTRLATLNGRMPVEALRPGMKVLTVSGAVRPVRWIGYRRIDLSRHPAPEEVCPIRIRANALEDGVPIRDLRVSPEHAMFLDRGLVPARLLVNGSSILKETECRLVVWYHVELDSHDLVLAEGAVTETYLDTGNRGLFENSGDPLILHPDFSAGQATRVARSCAPFLDQPAQVEPIWRRLTERAAGLGFETAATLPSTTDPNLAIRADGRLFRPVGVARGRHVFVLPPVDGEVRLVSRASPPNALRPWIEDRRGLGIAVSQITVRSARGTRVLTADDPALSDGWFAAEFDADGPRRWTNGDAALPMEPGPPAVVDIRCQPQPAYVLESKRRARIGVAPPVAGLRRARAGL